MICISKSTLMAGVTAQLLSAVSDEKNYRTVRLRLVVLCFCYASLCLNLVAPIGTIFLTIRFGSMPEEQVECLTTWFDHPKVGRSQLKYLSPSLWLRQSRRFVGLGTFTLGCFKDPQLDLNLCLNSSLNFAPICELGTSK
jgi:hypothetical protein